MKWRINETAMHHSIYEVEADTKEAAEARLRAEGYDKFLVSEFWGDTDKITDDITDEETE